MWGYLFFNLVFLALLSSPFLAGIGAGQEPNRSLAGLGLGTRTAAFCDDVHGLHAAQYPAASRIAAAECSGCYCYSRYTMGKVGAAGGDRIISANQRRNAFSRLYLPKSAV